jgi:N-acetylglucosaminyldiphosphoundecaprenol N-acetyl-beta-D-mannosaminyltransferase
MKIKRYFNLVNKETAGFYSFVNLSNLQPLCNSEYVNQFTYLSDGFLLTSLINLTKKNKAERCSFDFTSIAHTVFLAAEKYNRIVVLKGERKDIGKSFISLIKEHYPKLKVIYFDGYNNDWDNEIREISNLRFPIVIAGLGSGLQEAYGSRLVNKRDVLFFTCGGFLRQTTQSINSLDYYPKWINKFNLRFIYRMIKEPYTIKRYLISYPLNLIFFMKHSKSIQVED